MGYWTLDPLSFVRVLVRFFFFFQCDSVLFLLWQFLTNFSYFFSFSHTPFVSNCSVSCANLVWTFFVYIYIFFLCVCVCVTRRISHPSSVKFKNCITIWGKVWATSFSSLSGKQITKWNAWRPAPLQHTYKRNLTKKNFGYRTQWLQYAYKHKNAVV